MLLFGGAVRRPLELMVCEYRRDVMLGVGKRPARPHMKVGKAWSNFGFHFGEPDVKSGTRAVVVGAHCAMA